MDFDMTEGGSGKAKEMLSGHFHTPEDLAEEQRKAIADAALLSEGAHDEGNAQCVNLRYPNRFLHSKSFGWMAYTGKYWKHDAEAALGLAVTETIQARLVAAASSKTPSMYKTILEKCIPNNSRVNGAINQLSYMADCDPKDFDHHHHLLNCDNGVVNLKTGELTPHNPDQRFTYCVTVKYRPFASRDFWLNWLVDAVGEKTAQWLKMATGYSLTGSTKEEVLFYLYGPPRSGKGTFTETMRDLLGTPLSEAISFGILTAQRDVDTQNFLLAPLHSSRFISASETNQYERFNEAKLKTITGGDSISCSFKHKTPFSYRPQFKIWLASNQPVNADPDDDATWGRLRVVRFPNSKLGEEDKDLKEKMRTPEVLEGVLAWAVEGAIEWYKLGNKGLPELEDSAQTKMAHRADLENVQAWIDENCEPTDAFCAYSLLYGNYESWCKNKGVEQKKQKGFSQSLIRKGYINKAARDGDKVIKGFVGLKLR